MFKNNVPFKVAVGYGVVAAILIVAVVLVYSNTRSLESISRSMQEYTYRQERTDSAMAQMLADEQDNLRQLNEAIEKGSEPGTLYRKVKKLQSGADSVVVKPKTTEEHHVKNTTIEVAHTRKGFFRRFADLFRRSHADTVSIRRDSSLAGVDTVAKPVDISHKVARILSDADREQQDIARNRHKDVKKEMEDMKALTTFMIHEQTRKMETLRKNEQKLIHQDMESAMKARKRLIIQIVLLSCLAIATAVILLWRIYRDSEREKKYREALERANAETRRVMEQRERLLLTITHDIKAPAASITGFTDLLKDYIPSAKGLSLLGNVHDSAVHLSQLVASLLDYHQLENGLIKVNNTSFSPVSLASQCAMGMKPRADAKKLNLVVDANGCEGVSCRGDAFRIRQIVDNLLSNAVKYTDKGSIALTMNIEGNRLDIVVKDTGKGISEEEQTVIFQAFKRLGNAQGTEGAGLGLSIVSQLVTLLGGEISVKSRVGEGSEFSVSIPVGVEKEETTKQQYVTTEQEVKAYRNHQLLILDDDPLQLKLLQEIIRQTAGGSWTVIACNHVTDALTALHDVRPSLMFMDIEMPEMSGIDFIRHIDHHDMKVYAMTAHDESITAKLKEAGFDSCLFKPVKADDIRKILGVTSAPSIEAFTGGDTEDEREIMDAIKSEMSDFARQLSVAVSQSKPDRKTIAQVAHKLLPLSKMLNLDCVSAVETLTPEKIDAMSDEEIVKVVSVISQRIGTL